MMAEIKDIPSEMAWVIAETIVRFERNGGMYISKARFGDFVDEATGKAALFQVALNEYGMTVINVNSHILGSSTLDEINARTLKTPTNLPQNLIEAVVHECGHAKAYYGKSIRQIQEMNEALKDQGVRGISMIAEMDGAECIAEVEVLLFRGEPVPDDAMRLYQKYVRGG